MDEIRNLVKEIMGTFQQPYSEDIIDEVFCKIEDNRRWLNTYNILVHEQGKHYINPQIGRLVKEHTGLNTMSYPNVPKSTLIQSYSKLGDGPNTGIPEVQ